MDDSTLMDSASALGMATTKTAGGIPANFGMTTIGTEDGDIITDTSKL